jgi:RNA polymerase sigma factor (sigma-70 family)
MTLSNLWPFHRLEQQRFDAFVRPHLQQLYRLAYRLTFSRDDAEDLVQDVLIKLYPRLKELAAVDNPVSWMSRVLLNQYIDDYRRQQRSPLVSVEDESRFYQLVENLGPQPDDVAEREYSVQRLQSALQGLNMEQRMVILLHDVEGYSLEEIRQMRDVPLGTLKSRLHRARSKLQQSLKKMDPLSTDQRDTG